MKCEIVKEDCNRKTSCEMSRIKLLKSSLLDKNNNWEPSLRHSQLLCQMSSLKMRSNQVRAAHENLLLCALALLSQAASWSDIPSKKANGTCLEKLSHCLLLCVCLCGKTIALVLVIAGEGNQSSTFSEKHPLTWESFPRSPKAGRKLNCNSFRFSSHHDSGRPRWKADDPFLATHPIVSWASLPFGIINTFPPLSISPFLVRNCSKSPDK